jgi:hypothetical protein
MFKFRGEQAQISLRRRAKPALAGIAHFLRYEKSMITGDFCGVSAWFSAAGGFGGAIAFAAEAANASHRDLFPDCRKRVSRRMSQNSPFFPEF